VSAGVASYSTTPKAEAAALIRLSPKMKFAIKVSLSIVTVYLVAFWQGWSSASTSAITIALIASVESVGDSLTKGLLRVLGTAAGAVIGLWLIALFPQERMLYLLAASFGITFFFYLARVYRGDTTLFFLTGMTILLVFQDNNAQEAFLYGINRTYMTLFGIFVYTMIDILLWPTDTREDLRTSAAALAKAHSALFKNISDTAEDLSLSEIISREQRLMGTVRRSTELDLDRESWQSIIATQRNIGRALLLYLNDVSTHKTPASSRFLQHYNRLHTEVRQMLEALPDAWSMQKTVKVSEPFEVHYHTAALRTLPLLESAHLTSMLGHLVDLHRYLREASEQINRINAPAPTRIAPVPSATEPLFEWFDPEALKGSLITFLLFWTAVACWIWFNPPLGFYLVSMATTFTFLTTFSPLKPSILMLLYTISFLFALISYLFILPHLTTAWGLGLFLFGYSFITFYFVDLKAGIFFIIGLATLNITNEMQYAFDIFLLVLLFFYLFLGLLMLFYHIPFSSRPEHLFLLMKKRFFRLASLLSDRSPPQTHWGRWRQRHHMAQLHATLQKLRLWADKIDTAYFDGTEKKRLDVLLKHLQRTAYLLSVLQEFLQKQRHNPLIADFQKHYNDPLASWFDRLEAEHPAESKHHFEKEMEKSLYPLLSHASAKAKNRKEILGLFGYISLQKNLRHSLKAADEALRKIDTIQLRQSRF